MFLSYVTIIFLGPLWSWSYGSWIYNYLCNQCLSPLTLWDRFPPRRGVLNTTLCVKVSQWLATGRWFSQSIPASSTNKTNRHDITEIVLKVALNIITLTKPVGDGLTTFNKIPSMFVTDFYLLLVLTKKMEW